MSAQVIAPAGFDAAARIARTRAQNPDAVALARLLSLAVPIEPALMRAMRLTLMPGVDVGAEADLWFSPLIETRSRDGVMLVPAVAEELRKDLAAAERPQRGADKRTLADRCWEITRKLHDYLPPAVQLEEELNFLSLDPVGNKGKIKDLITSALIALIKERRDEVANWAGRALPRLSQAVRNTEDARMLAAASDLRLGRSLRAPYLPSDKPIPGWFAAVLPDTTEKVPLGVSLAGTMLVLDPTPAPSAQAIDVPATIPRVVEVREPGAAREPRVVFIDVIAAESVPLVGRGAIELATLAGEAYTLERIAGAGAAEGLACAAHANCNEALIVWQLAAPLHGLLGFALERIDATGEAEVIHAAVGFTRSTARTGRPLSTTAPIQNFMWIDRPARRGVTYRYRITPLVGTPDRLEPVVSLEARTPPVAIAVMPQGPITALFNTELGAARFVRTSQPEVRAYLGGELRRALIALLDETFASTASTVYVALSRLDDPELIERLARFGRRANVVLGAARLAKESARTNSVRRALGRVQVRLRGKAPAYAHSHFMVVCDSDGRPRAVWSGSVSWTVGALYGRDANALIIEDAQIAVRYHRQWQALAEDPAGASFKAANATMGSYALADRTPVSLWFAPQREAAELADVEARLAAARTAILFALGPRSPKDAVLRRIRARASELYVTGIARSLEGKRVNVYRHGTEVVVNPERPPSDTFEAAGLKLGPASLPVGSRLIVIDPFGDDPVVITGSHTLSIGASRGNDEDLLIIRGHRALAVQCAVHIKALVDHFAFRARIRAATARAMLSRDDR
jgi:hypothetical protein